MALLFSLREHKNYAAYNPDYSFTKQTATILRMTSTNASLGTGYFFVVVPRAWLHGKYVRWNWEGYSSGGTGNMHQVQIYDGQYVRSSNTDFPSGSGILIKGAGLLQTLAGHAATFAAETVDVQANVSAGTQTYCTIFFYLNDAYSAQNFWQQVDWFEINSSAGGVGNLYSEHFTDSVHMEVTGTYGDYGYISSGVIPYPLILTEILGLTDTVRKGTSITRKEILGLVDVFSRRWAIFRVFRETLGLTDSFLRLVWEKVKRIRRFRV